MSGWAWVIVGYAVLAVASLVPTLKAVIAPVKLLPGGASFEESTFSADGKKRLELHYSRLQGTLGFWKREAAAAGRFHFYCLWWTIISASLMPFLSQAIDPNQAASKWLLTMIAAHVALLLGFHRGLRVADRYKAFRHGESEFYDTYRRLLDRPESFGASEDFQVKKYFEEVELIRRYVRNAETDSLPTIEDVREHAARLKADD